jgi:cation:H+ antiporter
MILLQFIAGLLLLIVGAEALVRGASRLAAAFGIPPLIIGLTVVAFGTSSPELAVSLKSALSGQADVAVGNVVGSNIFNVLFILGVSALITPLVVAQQLVRLDVPLMILLSFGVLFLGMDGMLSRVEGAFLFILLFAYISFLIFQGRRESTEVEIEYENEYGPVRAGNIRTHLLNTALVIIGLGLLVLGSRWLVEGAVSFAGSLGVSELVIGLTIVAAGTSLPEVVTSIIAAIRGERDIAVGNVVGSNLFNIMAVLGLSGLVAPGGIGVPDAAIGFDIPVMIAVAVACLPIFFTGYIIARWEGAVFLGYYLAYTAYLVLNASAHDALPLFSGIMLWFVLPLTVLTLSVVAARAYRGRPGADSYPP